MWGTAKQNPLPHSPPFPHTPTRVPLEEVSTTPWLLLTFQVRLKKPSKKLSRSCLAAQVAPSPRAAASSYSAAADELHAHAGNENKANRREAEVDKCW